MEKSDKTKKILVLIAVIIIISLIVIFTVKNSKRFIKNESDENSISNNNSEYDVETYQVGKLYFKDFNDLLVEPVRTTSVKYNDAAYIDGEILINDDSVYLKYEKDGEIKNQKINIDDEKPKYVMVISINVVRYVYILTEDGNVYLNANQSIVGNDIDNFLNFSRISNLSNVSEMFLYGQTPYFMINNQLYTSYGEFACHDLSVAEDEFNLETSSQNIYYIQVGNDGLLYGNIIKKQIVVGSPESPQSILSHKKEENKLFMDSNDKNVIVDVLFGLNGETYLIDRNGNYYKIKIIDNVEIQLDLINSKKVKSINKYLKSSAVQKIDINYEDGTKDTYSKDEYEKIW